ncbi:uncharacterized protein [Physcomitrium patens]|uniref:uncharacterized protein isoform X1 n=1 Tax=Physcomitrium patens TaxID=3218 RepID=UPI003CCD4B11
MERSRFQYYALTIQESLRCSLDSRGILRRSLPSKETLSQQWLFLVTQPKTALQVPSNSKSHHRYTRQTLRFYCGCHYLCLLPGSNTYSSENPASQRSTSVNQFIEFHDHPISYPRLKFWGYVL